MTVKWLEEANTWSQNYLRVCPPPLKGFFLLEPMAYHVREDLSSCGQARLVLKEIKDTVSDYPDQILHQCR